MSDYEKSSRPRHRSKTISSLSGMFGSNGSISQDEYESANENSVMASSERESTKEMQDLAKALHRTKRKLLLKSARRPRSGVEKFKDIVLQLSVNADEDDTSHRK